MPEDLVLNNTAERDIDLLLLEELCVSESFRLWFVEQVLDEPVYQQIIDVEHSKVDPVWGESDIVFRFRSKTQETVAILIENKINAEPQPKQRERYTIRGNIGVEEGDWNNFTTCLTAPENYMDSPKNSIKYDHELSYEKIVEYIDSRIDSDKRLIFKRKQMMNAIGKMSRKVGSGSEPDPEASVFYKEYYAFCDENFPKLNMVFKENVTAGDTWVHFRPSSMIGAFKLQLIHSTNGEWVKLEFTGLADEQPDLERRFGKLLPANAKFDQSGSSNSAKVDIKVPFIDRTGKFKEQENDVREVLDAVAALEQFISKHVAH